jgi:hypothetical protein
MSRASQNTIVAFGALLCWLMLGQLLFVERLDRLPVLSGWRMLFYLLVFLAPLLTFVPIARWMRAPFFDVEAVAGWATLGLVLGLVTPADPPSLAQFLVFLLPLTVALATLGTLASYLAGLRVYRNDPRRYDIVRARRQGYLMAMLAVAGMLLFSVGTLSPSSAALLVLVGVLAEMFALSRDAQRAGRIAHG